MKIDVAGRFSGIGNAKTVETDIVKLVVEIGSFNMSSDEFDKETGSSDGLQPKEADLSCVVKTRQMQVRSNRKIPPILELHIVLNVRLSPPYQVQGIIQILRESISVPNEMSTSKSVTTNEKVVSESKEVEPSCATHVKTPRQQMKNQGIPEVKGKNWNKIMERELGEGYSFIKKKCFVCGSLSHLIKYCDFYEKKMAREAELKKQRVFNIGNEVAKPIWNNANRVNRANHFVPRPVQLNAVRSNVNTGSANVNTVRANVNSVRQNVNSVRTNINTSVLLVLNVDQVIIEYLAKDGEKDVFEALTKSLRKATDSTSICFTASLSSVHRLMCVNFHQNLRLDINALALSDRHPTYHETPSDQVKMDNPNITMEEYIRLEEEKSRRRGKVYNWETATYGKIWDNEDVHDLGSVENEFPAIVFTDTLTSKATLSCEPTVGSLNNNEIDFRISFDESDDEDCTVIFDKNSFSYKIISVNNLKTDSKNDNDKVNMPLLPSPEPTVSYFDDLDYFKDFEKEFPAIVYNDALTSKLDFLTEPTVSPQHINEFNLKDETSLSECDEEEQNVICFNDLFPFNVIYPDDSKSDKDNDDDKVDIKRSLGGNVVNTDVGAYAH
ncbi:hypothetical protein Tco_0716363, partial [Tanacetum coccineum]